MRKFFRDPQLLLLKASRCGLIRISDRKYIELNYYEVFGRKPNLDNPKTFSEKINWIKLHRTGKRYSEMVDKITAKEVAKGLIGESHIVPTYGIYEKFDDIDFEALPKKFVIKCNHDSGGLVICKDKSQLDLGKVREKINKSLHKNYYYDSREPIYNGIKPRILIEKNLSDDIQDYKFYCFNGHPKFLYISKGWENHEDTRVSFLNMDFTPAPFRRTDHIEFDKLPKRPDNFDEMIEIAEKLANGIDFVRVDLYNVGGKIYFSEFTFTPCSGMMPVSPKKYDLVLGKMLRLNNVDKKRD